VRIGLLRQGVVKNVVTCATTKSYSREEVLNRQVLDAYEAVVLRAEVAAGRVKKPAWEKP
jgi:hypothetical protein